MRRNFEDFISPDMHTTSKPGTIKRRAASYLGLPIGEPLSRAEIKSVEAKAHKIKDSTKKTNRALNHELAKQYR